MITKGINFRLIFFLLDYFLSAENPLQCTSTFLLYCGSELHGKYFHIDIMHDLLSN